MPPFSRSLQSPFALFRWTQKSVPALMIFPTPTDFQFCFINTSIYLKWGYIMQKPGRPHCPTCPTLSYFVLLFSFDKKCPTFELKIAQMSYFVLLLRVCVLLFNDGWRNDNFWVVFVEFFAATRQENPSLVLTCYWNFCRYAARRPNIGPCSIVHSRPL